MTFETDRKEYYAKYRAENRDFIAKRHKEWRIRNKEAIAKKQKEYRAKNKEVLKEKKKIYSAKNKEHKNKYQREFSANNQEYVKKYRKEYYIKNKEAVKKKVKDWQKTEKGRTICKKNNHKRRTLLKNSIFNLTTKDINNIFKRDISCVYCNSFKVLSLDHIKPLSKGGWTTFNNIVLACNSCNSSKGNKNVLKWCMDKKIDIPSIVLELLEKHDITITDTELKCHSCDGVYVNGN